MKKGFYIILLAGLCSCTTYLGSGNWQSMSASDESAPIARHEAAFVKVEDHFYLLGGRGIRPVSIFNTKTNQWTKGAPPPIEVHHFQPVVYQNKIWIAGAYTGGWPTEKPIDHIMIYDPAKDSWEKGPDIPKDRLRGAAGALLYENKIYISCGLKNGHIGDHKKWLDSYDLKTGNWETLPDAPRTRDHFNAVVSDNKMYLLAGRNTENGDNPFGNTIGVVDVFDFKKNTWTSIKKEIPTKRAGNAAILYHKEILVIGGESDTQEMAHNDIEALHTKSHEWRKLKPMQQGRHGTGALLFGNKVYLASGCGKRGGEPELTSMESFSFGQAKKSK